MGCHQPSGRHRDREMQDRWKAPTLHEGDEKRKQSKPGDQPERIARTGEARIFERLESAEEHQREGARYERVPSAGCQQHCHADDRHGQA